MVTTTRINAAFEILKDVVDEDIARDISMVNAGALDTLRYLGAKMPQYTLKNAGPLTREEKLHLLKCNGLTEEGA